MRYKVAIVRKKSHVPKKLQLQKMKSNCNTKGYNVAIMRNWARYTNSLRLRKHAFGVKKLSVFHAVKKIALKRRGQGCFCS